MRTITLTIAVTDEEGARLVERFIATANAVTESDDAGTTFGDPNGDKRDNTGVVWDARYHGANMAKNQDGTWRRKKGLSDDDKALADQYEAGCRGGATEAAQAAVAAPVAAAPVAAAPTAPNPDVPAFLQTGAFAPAPVAAPVMTMPGMPAAAPPAPPPAPSYDELIAAFQATIGRVGQPTVDANLALIYQTAGVIDMAQLQADGEKRRSIVNSLNALQPVTVAA